MSKQPEQSDPQPLVKLAEVNKWFGELHVLRDVSLEVRRGQKMVICGPSGSGKSTLIRCINGLERHQSGRIEVLGTTIGEHRRSEREVRRQVGMVFQQFNLFPHLTVLRNLTLSPMRTLGLSKAQAHERAMHYLERVRIPDQANKFPQQLSGGQQQRVAIARSLCMEPQAMLFDEPTSALDPEMIAEVLDVMVELADQGMTMICVTHEMGFARKVADTVVFMDEGNIVEQAPPVEFFASAKTARAKQFLNQILAH